MGEVELDISETAISLLVKDRYKLRLPFTQVRYHTVLYRRSCGVLRVVQGSMVLCGTVWGYTHTHSLTRSVTQSATRVHAHMHAQTCTHKRAHTRTHKHARAPAHAHTHDCRRSRWMRHPRASSRRRASCASSRRSLPRAHNCSCTAHGRRALDAARRSLQPAAPPRCGRSGRRRRAHCAGRTSSLLWDPA
jgi:hypothetical protein